MGFKMAASIKRERLKPVMKNVKKRELVSFVLQ